MKTSKKVSVVATLAALALFSSSKATAGTFTNGGFETAGIDLGDYATLSLGDDTSIPGWKVASGDIDYIGSYWTGSDGGRSIDLNGYGTFGPGAISQTFDTVVGATYTVTFDMSGNPDGGGLPTDHPYWSPTLKQLTVSTNATGSSPATYSFDTSNNSIRNGDWTKGNTYTFTATTTATTLTFASAIPGAFGPVLDNVVTTEALPPAPVVTISYPAAPSIAAQYLKAKGIKSNSTVGKNAVSAVAVFMGPSTDFYGVKASDPGYAKKVTDFVDGCIAGQH